MATATLFTHANGDLIFDANLISISVLSFTVFVYFDESVDGLNEADFSIAGTINTGTLSFENISFQGSGRLYSLEYNITSFPLQTDADRNGTITITLAANAVTQGNAETTLTFNWNYYKQDLVYTYSNTRPDEFTLLKAGVGRFNSLSIQHGKLYGKRYNQAKLIAMNISDGAYDTTKDIDLPVSVENAIFVNNTVYCLKNKHLIKAIEVSDTDYTTEVNSVEYQESKADTNSDFLAIGKNGFFLASETQQGQPAIPGTPGGGGTRSFYLNSSNSSTGWVSSTGDTTVRLSGRQGSVYLYINGKSQIEAVIPPNGTWSGRVSSVRVSIPQPVSGSATITITTPTTPGTPGRPSTQDFGFVPRHIAFQAYQALQEKNTNKEIYDGEYGIGGINLPIFEYKSGAYDYRDMFLLGYDGEHHYVKAGPYIVLVDDDLKFDQNTYIKSVATTHLYPPAYAVDEKYVYRATANNLYRCEKSKFHKPAPRHKIYPIIVYENSTIDLRPYIMYAERFTWADGYEPQPYVSLSGHTLSVGSVTEETIVSPKLMAFNRKGYTDEPVQLDIVIQKRKTTPEWIDIKEIVMSHGETLNLTKYVQYADSLSSVTLPTGTTLSGFTLTIGEIGGSVTLRATQGGNTADVTFDIALKQLNFSDDAVLKKWVIKIADIDVSHHLVTEANWEISKTLDPVQLNEFIVNTTELVLSNPQGIYSHRTPRNFWEQHDLNIGGYQEPVNISALVEDGGVLKEQLIFSGIIVETQETKNGQIKIEIDDISFFLPSKTVVDTDYPQFVGIQKYAQTQKGKETYQGEYNLEYSSLPLIQGFSTVYNDGVKLPILGQPNLQELATIDNTVYLTETQVLSKGGYLNEPPVVAYRQPFFRKPIEFFIDQIGLISELFSPTISLASQDIDENFIQSNGNLLYDILPTRITHIVRDWTYDSVNRRLYVLLSQADQCYADHLIAYDIKTQTSRIVKSFDKNLTCLKMDYSNGVFGILVTGSIAFDRSQEGRPKDTFEVVSHYNNLIGSQAKILKYVISTDTISEWVSENAAAPPQPGSHYYVGFENEYKTFNFEGIVPDSRGKFKNHNSELYFRFATDAQFGVAKVSSGGTLTQLWSIANNKYFNYLKFDFDINTAGTVFIGYCEQSTTGSTLQLKKYVSGGSVDVLTDTKTFSQLTEIVEEGIFDEGGWYAGVSEVFAEGDDVYMSVEIGKTDYYYNSSNTLTLIRSISKNAGCVIYKIDTSLATPTLEVIEKYQYSQTGGRSLTKHKDTLFFVESPPEKEKYITPDSDEPIIRNKSNLKRIDSDGTVTNLGNIWYDTQNFDAIACKLLTFDDTLHLLAYYSNADTVLQEGSIASSYRNFQWLKYGQKLEFILERLGNQNLYDILSDFSIKLNRTFNVTTKKIILQERILTTFQLNGSLDTSATILAYDSPSSILPDAGIVLIDAEVITYTGKTDTHLTGLQRGVGESKPNTHVDNSQCILLDATLNSDDIYEVDMILNPNFLFNIIFDPNTNFSIRDSESIAKNQEKPYSLNLGLTSHDSIWAQQIFQEYLKTYKDIKYDINLTSRINTRIELGDIISFVYLGKRFTIQVLSINYENSLMHISGHTIPPVVAPALEKAYYSDGYGNYYSDGYGNYYSDGKP